MYMATKKKAVKAVKKHGKAHPTASAAPKEPILIRIKAAVDVEDLKSLEATVDRLADKAAQISDAAAVIAQDSDPNEKQLHRRVLVVIYDAAGVRMSNSSYDLDVADVLYLTVGMAGVEAKQASGKR
jgi:hypothetical protein